MREGGGGRGERAGGGTPSLWAAAHAAGVGTAGTDGGQVTATGWRANKGACLEAHLRAVPSKP